MYIFPLKIENVPLKSRLVDLLNEGGTEKILNTCRHPNQLLDILYESITSSGPIKSPGVRSGTQRCYNISVFSINPLIPLEKSN